MIQYSKTALHHNRYRAVFHFLHLLLHLEQFPLQLLPQEHPPLFFIIYLTAKNSPIKTANKRIQSKNPIFHSPYLNQHQYLVDNK